MHCANCHHPNRHIGRGAFDVSAAEHVQREQIDLRGRLRQSQDDSADDTARFERTVNGFGEQGYLSIG